MFHFDTLIVEKEEALTINVRALKNLIKSHKSHLPKVHLNLELPT